MKSKNPLINLFDKDVNGDTPLEQALIRETSQAPQDAWIDAIPLDPYALCPCGCGMKWRFVLKGGEKELDKHEARFIQALKQPQEAL